MRNSLFNEFIDLNEFKTAIRHQKSNRAVWVDIIPSGIFKTNIDWWANELFRRFKTIRGNEQTNGWKDGIIICFFKKGDKRNINNYRPITPPPTIYKIWTAILGNRLAPILNILTNEQQFAYKTNKSTMGVIYTIKKKIP